MTLLPLGVVEGPDWNFKGLDAHMRACQTCSAVYNAMASAMGSRGGATVRGEKKRRGDREHHRRLAARSWGRSA